MSAYRIIGLDGREIAAVNRPAWIVWPFIAVAVAAWFNTDADAVDWQDTADGRAVTVGNWPVGYIVSQ